jgi:acetate kinase
VPISNEWMCMNSSSSSLKCALYQPEEAVETALANGIIERIGLPQSRLWMRTVATAPALDEPGDVPGYALAVYEVRAALDTLRLPLPDAMGYRVVHGDTDHAPRRL